MDYYSQVGIWIVSTLQRVADTLAVWQTDDQFVGIIGKLLKITNYRCAVGHSTDPFFCLNAERCHHTKHMREEDGLIGCQFNDWKAFNRVQLIDRHDPENNYPLYRHIDAEIRGVLIAVALRTQN